MHPGEIAAAQPEKPAYIMGKSGQIITFSEMEAGANQCAHLFRALGLRRGDHIAIMLENHPWFLRICWAAQRAGLYFTPVSWRLLQGEIAYIINDCEAQVFIASERVKQVVQSLRGETPKVRAYFMLDGEIEGFRSFEAAIAALPTTPIEDQSEGALMPYSSGTTGYPKGIMRPLSEKKYGDGEVFPVMTLVYGANQDSVYLSTAPLYHSAPLGFSLISLRHGITVVILEDFDAQLALECIETYGVTHSQWVPTMFVRMLKLPEDIRKQYDISSMQCAIHGAAPCSIIIKEKMIEWWGEIIYEYYAGSEANGFVQLNSAEWLSHKGSVGKPMGCEIHICNEAGDPLPVGETGIIYFAGDTQFAYFKDNEKTAGSRNDRGWSTLGDIGYLDDDGYLYLTDRQHFMIISGGVNIYPQEIENILAMHEMVMDVAVFGVPNDEFGEEVKAAVELVDSSLASTSMEIELLDFCRKHLSSVKCPRSIDFHDQLPRHPTGKLYKRLLKDKYWPQ